MKNKAVLKENEIVEHTDCEECLEDYIFLMKDNYHEFEIGLRTILACLAFAEKEGAVPPIDSEWWCAVRSSYPELHG